MSVGIDRDTAAFAATTIRRWWWRMGRPLYPIGVKVSDDEFAGVQCRPDTFFYQMLFDLKVGELSGTQFVIIDKEYHAPPAELKLDHSCRRVRPNDDAGATDFPPLIPKYSGK